MLNELSFDHALFNSEKSFLLYFLSNRRNSLPNDKDFDEMSIDNEDYLIVHPLEMWIEQIMANCCSRRSSIIPRHESSSDRCDICRSSLDQTLVSILSILCENLKGSVRIVSDQDLVKINRRSCEKS